MKNNVWGDKVWNLPWLVRLLVAIFLDFAFGLCRYLGKVRVAHADHFCIAQLLPHSVMSTSHESKSNDSDFQLFHRKTPFSSTKMTIQAHGRFAAEPEMGYMLMNDGAPQSLFPAFAKQATSMRSASSLQSTER